MKYENILIDMDGTLIETDYANNVSYILAAESVSSSYKYEMSKMSEERITRNHILDLKGVDAETVARIIKLKKLYYRRNLDATKIISDNIITITKNPHTNIYLVTRSEKERAMQTLLYHGFDRLISGIVTKEDLDEQNNKYKTALTKLQIDPYTSLAIDNEIKECYKAEDAKIKYIIKTN